MLPQSYPIPQREPPLPPQETLPTMYDLPSEDLEEPGLPDEYHDLQPQLLSRTFRCRRYSPEQALTPDNPRIWIPELEIGLGLWQGTFEGITRQWLRWYDDQDRWVPTDTELALELAEQERLRAEEERLRADRAAAQLRQVVRNLLQSGMSLEQVVALTGLSPEQVQGME